MRLYQRGGGWCLPVLEMMLSLSFSHSLSPVTTAETVAMIFILLTILINVNGRKKAFLPQILQFITTNITIKPHQEVDL